MLLSKLYTRGEFVLAPDGRFGMIRTVNKRENMCLVQFGATGFMDSIQRIDDDELREQGMAKDYHFTTLRAAPAKMIAHALGETG